MANLDSMQNIGKEMKAKLMSIGIRSSQDLIRIGSKEAFSQLKNDIQMYVLCTYIHFKELSITLNSTNYLRK